jgi:type I site-specific restriction endonuclease
MTINFFGRNTIFNLGDETIDEDADQLDIPIHAFDLVIADECHRGYTSSEVAVWRKTLDHFDAIKIGLTATPAAHTTGYFKDVVFRYEYERAVRDGYLVDYDVVSVNSNVRMQGVFLKEGEEVGVVNPATGAKQLDLLEDERQFDTTEVEEKVTSPDSNRKFSKRSGNTLWRTKRSSDASQRRSSSPLTTCPIRRTRISSWTSLATPSGAGIRSCRRSPATWIAPFSASESFATASFPA